MQTFNPTSDADFESEIFYVEVDVVDPSKLLVADGCALVISDGTSASTVLAGRPKPGWYAEGNGVGGNPDNDVLFNDITAFVQLGTTQVILVDSDNFCVRKYDRTTFAVSLVAGQCGATAMDTDGTGAAVRFGKLAAALRDVSNPDTLYLADHTHKKIKTLTISSGLVAEFGSLSRPTLVTALAWPSTTLSQTMLVIEVGKIRQADTSSGAEPTTFFENPVIDDVGVTDIVYLNHNVYVVTDYKEKRVAIFDQLTDEVVTVCTGADSDNDGTADTCTISDPTIMLLVNGNLYIASGKKIRYIGGKYFVPNYYFKDEHGI